MNSKNSQKWSLCYDDDFPTKKCGGQKNEGSENSDTCGQGPSGEGKNGQKFADAPYSWPLIPFNTFWRGRNLSKI